MYRIGEFSALSHVEVRTLRYYDEVGILRPAHVERGSRYRMYRAEQLSQLNKVLALKDLGFSLAEIRAHLAERTPAAQLRTALHDKHRALEEQLESTRRRVARVAARLDMMPSELPSLPEIALRRTKARRVASVRDTITTFDEAERLFAQLDRALGRHRAAGYRGAVFHACAPGAIDCEVFEAASNPPRGVRTVELPATQVAVLVYRGDSDFLHAYRDLRTWTGLVGLAIAGPKREIYLRASGESITEVQFPVTPTSQQATSPGVMR